MSEKQQFQSETGAPDAERREALIKLGKYTAYAAPMIVVTVSAAQGAPVSGPTPTPAPPM